MERTKEAAATAKGFLRPPSKAERTVKMMGVLGSARLMHAICHEMKSWSWDHNNNNNNNSSSSSSSSNNNTKHVKLRNKTNTNRVVGEDSAFEANG